MNAIQNTIIHAVNRLTSGLQPARRMRAAALLGLTALAVTAAQAAPVTFSSGQLEGGTPLTLSSSNVTGGLLASTSTFRLIAVPADTVGLALSGQPAETGGSATLTFGLGGVSAVSFEWGTPDSYNTLVVTDIDLISYQYPQSQLADLLTNYGGSYLKLTSSIPIQSLTFVSNERSAFEAANFRVQDAAAAVPEPGTLALAGLALLAAAAVHKKRRALS